MTAQGSGHARGNWGSPEAVPALALNDEEALVRGHAAWALGRIGTEAARQALAGRAELEADAWVREEIAAALDTLLPARLVRG
jgi:epoxyqueuosine reductase